MKVFNFNSTHGNNYTFRREPEKRQWHIWFGSHVWTIQFNCKCNACRLTRIRKLLEKFGIRYSDEELMHIKGAKGEAIKKAITQARFRESIKQ